MISYFGVFKSKLVMIACLVFLIVGYFAGNLVPLSRNQALNKNNVNTVKENPVFAGQSANINGKITNINGDKITVLNSSNNQSDSFTLSKDVSIINFTSIGKSATPSSDIKTIPLNKNALIYLQAIDGQYQVISISYNSYTPPPPSKKNSVRF